MTNQLRTQEEWKQEYKDKDALWIHDGNPKKPHALLTSGQHSNGFFNSRLVIPDEELMHEAACDLLAKLAKEYDLDAIEGVVGPQTGATKLASLMSHFLKVFNQRDNFFASPSKSQSGGVKSMDFTPKEEKLLKGNRLLLCEDVMSTGGSIKLTVDAITPLGGRILPFVLVLVNRSGLQEVNGRKIISLIDHHMPMWTPEECLLCKGGSEAIRPKEKENWALLNS